jgi:pimeloyl-ACP methyl ester carboxylesterase
MEYSPFKSENCKLLYEKKYDDFAKHWPIPSECKTIKTSWGTSFVRISGLTKGKTIVLLPSAATTSLMWSNIVQDLVNNDYKLVAIDNIHEFGRSYYSAKLSSTADLVDWLDQTLKQIGIIDEIELMGLSLGAWLCAQYGLSHFSRIRRITLIAPFMTIYWPRLGIYPRLLMCAIPSIFLRKQFCYWFFNNAYHGNSEARQSVNRWVEELNLGFNCFRLKSPVKMNLLKVEQLLKIQGKTGIILGLKDRGIYSKNIIDRLERNDYKGEIKILSDAGHDLTFTHRSMIIDFLKR